MKKWSKPSLNAISIKETNAIGDKAISPCGVEILWSSKFNVFPCTNDNITICNSRGKKVGSFLGKDLYECIISPSY